MWRAWRDVLKRLVVYEATYAKTATSQKGTLQRARLCKMNVLYLLGYSNFLFYRKCVPEAWFRTTTDSKGQSWKLDHSK